MSYSSDTRVSDQPALPTDITLRAPVYRQRGIIVSLITTALARWTAQRQLGRITRRYRRPPRDFDIPPYLREDIGLPPLPPPSPAFWETWR